MFCVWKGSLQLLQRMWECSLWEQINNRYIEKFTNNNKKAEKISSSRNHKKNIQSQDIVCLHGCDYVNTE